MMIKCIFATADKTIELADIDIDLDEHPRPIVRGGRQYAPVSVLRDDEGEIWAAIWIELRAPLFLDPPVAQQKRSNDG